MTTRVDTLDYARFDVSEDHGFLPDSPPITALDEQVNPRLQSLEVVSEKLPNLLERDTLRPTVRDLEAPSTDAFDGLTERELFRVYTVAGFLANAYVHKTDAPDAEAIPSGVAVPLSESTNRLGCTPVLSYDAYVLNNWRQTNENGERTPESIRPLTTFFGLPDERWFIAIHVAIESMAGPAIAAIGDAQQGVLEDNPDRIRDALQTITNALAAITDTLDRMAEHNDPNTYNEGFRPYLSPISDVKYEGVDRLNGPQSYRGASGAQSSCFPALDTALGIDHGDNPLVDHLHTLRKDMYPPHREFIETVEREPDIDEYVANADDPLREAYNDCIDRMVVFREHHIDVVETFLTAGSTDGKGTGGTPYGQFLGTFIDDTRDARLTATSD